jgi:hypothetical protein
MAFVLRKRGVEKFTVYDSLSQVTYAPKTSPADFKCSVDICVKANVRFEGFDVACFTDCPNIRLKGLRKTSVHDDRFEPSASQKTNPEFYRVAVNPTTSFCVSVGFSSPFVFEPGRSVPSNAERCS